MKDEFIEYGGDIHPIEAEFFKELMLLCAKYGVKMKPNIFSESDSKDCKKELDDKEKIEYPAIEFEFRDSSFVNDNFDIDASCYNGFQNLDDERDLIGINGIPVDKRKIWYSNIDQKSADNAYEIMKHFQDGTLEQFYENIKS